MRAMELLLSRSLSVSKERLESRALLSSEGTDLIQETSLRWLVELETIYAHELWRGQ